ncbi:MAG: serine/threonine-protein kinase [Dokdonella sp.]
MKRERVSELFEQAIDMAPGDRAAWLAEQCAHDAGLLAEIERLLRADAMAQRFMEQPPALIAGAAASAAAPCASDVVPPAFGAYRIVRSLGQGGMGEVWLAERNDGEFEQRVAIKQVAYPTPGLLLRFRQERQILARLEHPNIARLIDGGLAADATPYLVMEFVEGVPITDYVRAHALDLPGCLRLFLHVCAAVQYAHQSLVVHRDLKPSNIFVTADGTPKLLDFGIAKVLTTTDAGAPTQTMARLLTPDYAAPEQFQGGAITTATDVYALGVVLYELLAGRRPPRSSAGDSTDTSHAATAVLPPSAALEHATSTISRRALRGDADRIVLTALARDPRRRYPSAEALAADIQRFLDGRPIAARGDGKGYRLRMFVRRHRYALGAAVIVFAVCIAATLVSQWQARIARELATRAEAAQQFLVGVFEQANPDQNKGGAISAQSLLEKGELQLSSDQSRQPAIQADLTGLIGALYWNIGDYERAESLIGKAVAMAADPRVPDEIKARNFGRLASIENDKRKFDATIEHAGRALDLAKRAGSAGTRDAIDARRVMALAMVGQGRAKDAVPLLREVLAQDRLSGGDRSGPVALDLYLLGEALDELSSYGEAETLLREGIATAREVHGNLHSSVANGLNELGLMLGHKGDVDASEAPLREALEINRQLYGANHRETLVSRSNLLRVLENQGRFEEALQGRLEVLKATEAIGDARPEQVAYAHNFIALDYRNLGRAVEAEQASRAALAVWAKVQGSNDEWDSADPMRGLAQALQLQGRFGEAEAAYRAALAVEARHEPANSHWLNRDRGFLGELLRLQHRHADALQELREASAAISVASGNSDPIFCVLQSQLAEAELDAGDADAALRIATRALDMARSALPPRNYRLGGPLFAQARAELANGHAARAEPLLRETLAVRHPPYPGDDLRVLEVKASLIGALIVLQQDTEARSLRSEIEPLLKASPSPYANDLLARLALH